MIQTQGRYLDGEQHALPELRDGKPIDEMR
jgi:hypothetical protein